MEFPQAAIEALGYYVYTLTDPRDNKIFYVGKGTGNRIFQHIAAASKGFKQSDKIATIQEIRKSGLDVGYEIIRHGLTEDQALEVEAALIDFIGLPELANVVAGYAMDTRGRMSVKEIIAAYTSEPITIKEKALLIIVNRLYHRNISEDDLYEITRGNWVLGVRRKQVDYALSVYKGIVRQVYRINAWHPIDARNPSAKIQKRWRFDGDIADELQGYVGGSVEKYLKPGAQWPTKYINC